MKRLIEMEKLTLAKNNTTLRKQFSIQIISIFLIIALLSSGVQLYFMNKQIDYEIEKQSYTISQSINHGIKETDLATRSIEHQIDLKLTANAKHIGDMLSSKKASEVTNEELQQIKKKFGLTDISVFTKTGDDIVVVRATDPAEIGFSLEQAGEIVINAGAAMLNGEEPFVPGSYTEKGLLVLPTMMSEVHENQFFKYAYYHPEGADYFVNPYIAADEVNKFTEEVGPNSWIKKIEKEISFVKDVSVLDPKVFQNPELEKQFWPPLKKVVYGDFQYQTDEDNENIISMLEEPVKRSYVEKVDGEKVLKVMYPTPDDHVILITLDYQQMIGPLLRHSLILFISGIILVLVLLLLTVRFFNRIYEHIKKITNQIKSLEDGDLTAMSLINDNNELGKLSESTNRMVSQLNKLVQDTQIQATKTQSLSLMLEAEASQSVEKMYELSTESTIKSREQLYDISSFLDETVSVLSPYKGDTEVLEIIGKIDRMREVAKERTAETTNFTLTLSDLLNSLHGQSSELADISNSLLEQMSKFKL